MLGDKQNMEEKKNDEKIDWNALDRHWADRYEDEFGHLF